MNFLRLVQAEFLKTKSFPFPLFFIILTILSITIAFSSFYRMTHVEFLHQLLDINPNPWYAYYFKGYLFFFVFLFPAIVSITTYVIKIIEDRADAWKRLLVLPYNRFLLHSSKLMVIYSFVTFYLIITFILLVLSGSLLSVLKHDFNFKNYDTYHPFLFIFFIKFEIAALAICTFSYAYMIIIRRTTASLLLSIFLPFIALTFTNQYSSPLYQFFSFFRMKHQMIVNKSFDYNMIALNWISRQDVLCFVIIAISLGIIIQASKKPMINYE